MNSPTFTFDLPALPAFRAHLEPAAGTRQLSPAMSDRVPPELDLLPDGSFRPRRPPLAARIFRWAVVVALLAVALALAAFALWFALVLIPVAIAAGLIAWLAFRYQLWRAGRSGARNPWQR
jgi:fatty acid desaturase